MIHGLELSIHAQDLIKAYQTSMHFQDIHHYITDEKLPSGTKHKIVFLLKHLIM